MAIMIQDFNKAQADQYGEYGMFVDLKPNGDMYTLDQDGTTYTVMLDSNDEWVCEIDTEDDCIACWQGDTPEDALKNALVEAYGTDAIRREDNCEDAVNETAYGVFVELTGSMPTFDTDEETELLDELLQKARGYVKANCKARGMEWEEF